MFESLARATAAGSKLRTSQIAMPEAASKLVYASSGYEQSARNDARTTLANDNVFRDAVLRDAVLRDGATPQTPSFSGDAASGITIKLDVPV